MLDFRFPDIGEGIAEGKLMKWLVKVGDKVKEGDSLFLVETDKVNAEIPSPAAGIVAELMAEEGDTILVDHVIVRIKEEIAENITDTRINKDARLNTVEENESENAGVVGAIEVSSEVIEDSFENKENVFQNNPKILATPVARKLAKDLGVDITKVKGSGLSGRVMKEDIYKASDKVNGNNDRIIASKWDNHISNIESANGEVSQSGVNIAVPPIKFSGDIERIPLTAIRKTIVKNMVLSKRVIPHAAVMNEFDITELVGFRKEIKQIEDEEQVKLSYMPFIIKAVTLALKDYPVLNASFDEEKEEIILKKYYNIGIAVDTPEGLLVPVLKDADKMGIIKIGKELQALAAGARSRTLPLDKLQNGTFTITNYGAIGATHGIPIIKHPEAAILGIGKIAKMPVVNEKSEIAIRDIMNISLSIDHRIIDGGDAGRFLNKLKHYIQNPKLLLLS